MTVATKIDSAEPAQPLEITSLRGDVRAIGRPVARARRRRGRCDRIGSGDRGCGDRVGCRDRARPRPRVRARDRVERRRGVRRDPPARRLAELDHGGRSAWPARSPRSARRWPARRLAAPDRTTPTRRSARSPSRCSPRSVSTSRSASRAARSNTGCGAALPSPATSAHSRSPRRLYSHRPEVPIASLVVASGVAAAIGLVGYVRRCTGASTAQERARLQWVAWGVVVAAAISIGAWVLNALVDWPHPVAAVAAGSTLLVPFALAVGASDQLAVRIDRLLVHSITLTGLVGLVGASYLLIVLGLGHAPTGQREDAPRPVDARGGGSRRCSGCRRASASPSSRRAASTAKVTRPTRCSARSGAASRARSPSTSCCSSSPSR